MSHKIFYFQEFGVSFDSIGMSLTTDSVLFGSWCGFYLPETASERMLDAGTGTGILSLILAQRRPRAEIFAIDIDPRAAATAARNFALSPWSARLAASPGDIRSFALGTGKGLVQGGKKGFAAIVSNPPYYKNSPPLKTAVRGLARTEHAWSAAAFWDLTERTLEEPGWVAAVFPPERLIEYEKHAAEKGFTVRLATLVSSRPDLKPYIGFYIFGKEGADLSFPEACDNGAPPPDFQEHFSIRDATGDYSDYTRALTADLYLYGRRPEPPKKLFPGDGSGNNPAKTPAG